jgi:hypothetical protein
MPRPPAILTLLLGLLAVTAAGYAWHLRALLAEAGAARDRSAGEVKRLEAQVRDLSLPRPIATEFPANPLPQPRPGPETAAPPRPQPGMTPDQAARQRQRDAISQSPEALRLRMLGSRNNLDQRFGALFRKLNLPPAELEKLKDLLVEREMVSSDVYQAARSLGLNPRESREQLQQQVASSQAAIDAEIAAALGNGVVQELQEYQQTAPQRGLASQLERRLSYSSTPLSFDQSEALIGLLANQSGARTTFAGAAADQEALEMGPGFRNLRYLDDATLGQAATFLSASQVAALRQMRDEALLRAQLQEQVRERTRAVSGDNAPTAANGPSGR